MVVTVLQILVPILVAVVAALTGVFRLPTTRRRASIEKDAEIAGKLPEGPAREELLALIVYEVQKLQQLEGYVTEAQVKVPPLTATLVWAQKVARLRRRTARESLAAPALMLIGGGLGGVLFHPDGDFTGPYGILRVAGLTGVLIGLALAFDLAFLQQRRWDRLRASAPAVEQARDVADRPAGSRSLDGLKLED